MIPKYSTREWLKRCYPKYPTREWLKRRYPDRDCREDFLDFHEELFGVKQLWRNKYRIPREMEEAYRKWCTEKGVPWKELTPYEPRPDGRPSGVDEIWEEDDTGVMRKVWSADGTAQAELNKEIQNENT